MNRDVPLHQSHSFIIDPESALGARSWVSAVLDAWRLDAASDPVTLITAELVTNAIRYGEGPIDVELWLDGALLKVAVSDHADGPVERCTDVPLHATSGRGLRIIGALADTWGVDELPGGGKTVWAELAVS